MGCRSLLEQLLLQQLVLVGSKASLGCSCCRCASLQLHLVAHQPAGSQELCLAVVGQLCRSSIACCLVDEHLLVGSTTEEVLQVVLHACPALQACRHLLLLLEQVLVLLLQLVLAQLLLDLLLLLQLGLLLLLLLELGQGELLLLLLLLELLLLTQLQL